MAQVGPLFQTLAGLPGMPCKYSNLSTGPYPITKYSELSRMVVDITTARKWELWYAPLYHLMWLDTLKDTLVALHVPDRAQACLLTGDFQLRVTENQAKESRDAESDAKLDRIRGRPPIMDWTAFHIPYDFDGERERPPVLKTLYGQRDRGEITDRVRMEVRYPSKSTEITQRHPLLQREEILKKHAPYTELLEGHFVRVCLATLQNPSPAPQNLVKHFIENGHLWGDEFVLESVTFGNHLPLPSDLSLFKLRARIAPHIRLGPCNVPLTGHAEPAQHLGYCLYVTRCRLYQILCYTTEPHWTSETVNMLRRAILTWRGYALIFNAWMLPEEELDPALRTLPWSVQTAIAVQCIHFKQWVSAVALSHYGLPRKQMKRLRWMVMRGREVRLGEHRTNPRFFAPALSEDITDLTDDLATIAYLRQTYRERDLAPEPVLTTEEDARRTFLEIEVLQQEALASERPLTAAALLESNPSHHRRKQLLYPYTEHTAAMPTVVGQLKTEIEQAEGLSSDASSSGDASDEGAPTEGAATEGPPAKATKAPTPTTAAAGQKEASHEPTKQASAAMETELAGSESSVYSEGAAAEGAAAAASNEALSSQQPFVSLATLDPLYEFDITLGEGEVEDPDYRRYDPDLFTIYG